MLNVQFQFNFKTSVIEILTYFKGRCGEVGAAVMILQLCLT